MTPADPDFSRPDPDRLLERIQADEHRSRRGRLKIFVGMCPGVGKTYAMLQAARRKQAEGIEVVVGLVETHGRSETAALLDGLPIVPRVRIAYRGAEFEEMDIEGILLWKPRLAVVDELAHTNTPGSRHPKRYQDVLELLDGGIDVFTTLNIQHIESRSEAVRRLAGVPVRETVPDSVLDAADEIELIDITPEQLRQRLAEGRVYLGERAAAAAENFFRESHLAVLREMALRFTAEHVERRSRKERPAGQRGGELLVVGVSASPHSAQLLRWTRRYAAGLEAPWIAVAIETPRPLSAEDEQRRSANLRLARELGADVVLAAGTSVAETLVRVAREHRATHLILGKPHGPAWRWFFRSPIPWTIENSGGMDVQLIRTDETRGPSPTPPARTDPGIFREVLAVLGLTSAVTVAGLLILDAAGYWSVALLYLLMVTIAGLNFSRMSTLLLAGLSALAWNFLFIPPRFTFWIGRPHDVLMFAMFFVTALVVGSLTSRLRERELLESRRERRAAALFHLTRRLAQAGDLKEAVGEMMTQLADSFDLAGAVFLRDTDGRFEAESHPASHWKTDGSEAAVAQWVFTNQRPAGRTTDTLGESRGLYLPLRVGGQVEGVLAVDLENHPPLSPAQRELLETFADQFAVVAAKERGRQIQQQARIVAEAGQLQQTLFDSVSHELKTPIAAIQAALDQSEPDLGEVRVAAKRLRQAVSHLLDATRIESGLLQPTLEWCDVQEIVADALRLGQATGLVAFEPKESLAPIRADAGLLAQALAILVQNALVHAKAPERPSVSVEDDGSRIVFSVSDRGPGLPEGRDVFSKFVRGPSATPGGLGLGLPIARHLAEIHHGTVEAQARPGGGTVFRLRIPRGGPMKLPE